MLWWLSLTTSNMYSTRTQRRRTAGWKRRALLMIILTTTLLFGMLMSRVVGGDTFTTKYGVPQPKSARTSSDINRRNIIDSDEAQQHLSSLMQFPVHKRRSPAMTVTNDSNNHNNNNNNDDHRTSSSSTLRHLSRHEQQKLATTRQLFEDDDDDEGGSLYNNLNIAPLHLGLGTHYVHLWVGSPTPQRQTLIVDTGSHLTAFPCGGCDNCGEENHTDPYFDTTQSNTFFKYNNCQDCIEEATCNTSNNNGNDGPTCEVTQSYTEGSSWKAFQCRDKVFLGESSIDKDIVYDEITPTYSIDFIFWCQQHETGLFTSQLADGIMGLSAHPDTLLSTLVKSHKLDHHMSTLCFAPPAADPTVSSLKPTDMAGILTLGGVDTRLHDSEMLYAQLVNSDILDHGDDNNIHLHKNPLYQIPPALNNKHGGPEEYGGWYNVYVREIYLLEGVRTTDEYVKNFMTPQAMILDDVGHDHIGLSGFKGVDMNVINAGKGVILDSGTTDTYLHESLKDAFEKAWDSFMELGGNDHFKGYHNNGMILTMDQIMQFPAVILQLASAYTNPADDPIMQDGTSDLNNLSGVASSFDQQHPTDILLVIPPTHYLEYSASKNTFTSRLYFTESEGCVLGANALQGHDVLLDWEHGRIGIAKSTCQYDELEEFEEDVNEEVMEESTGGIGTTTETNTLPTMEEEVDCVLGPASVTLSCQESLHTEIHTKCPTNSKLMLEGEEKWIRVVERDSNKGGKSCDDVAKQMAQSESPMVNSFTPGMNYDLNNIEVSCSNEGICSERHPCTLSCESPMVTDEDHFLVQPSQTSTSTSGPPPKLCGDNLFGACQSSCIQSKVVSVLMNDSECHATEDVVTRQCHIDDCGKDHPCLVPFVVHAIFGFASREVGGEDRFWDKPHNEVFANALSEAILQLRDAVHSGTEEDSSSLSSLHVGPGDIQVTLVRNWRDATTSQTIGKKVTVEISIYNAEASEQQTKGTFHRGHCTEEELYPYSQAALQVHNMMLQDHFVQTVLDITINAGTMHADHSSFDVEYLSKPFDVIDSTDSKMLSSWTIKTEATMADNYNVVQSSKMLLKDPAVWAFVFAIVLFILSCGIYFGYKLDQRRDEEIEQSLMERIRIQTSRARAAAGRRYVTTSKGEYAKISTDDNEHDDDDLMHDDDHYLSDHPTSNNGHSPYKDNVNGGERKARAQDEEETLDFAQPPSSNNNKHTRKKDTQQVDEENENDSDDDDDLGDIEFA